MEDLVFHTTKQSAFIQAIVDAVDKRVEQRLSDFIGEVCYRKEQTSFLLGISVRTLERNMERKEIGFVADGDLVLFRKSHIDDYAARNTIAVDYRRLADFPNIKKAS